MAGIGMVSALGPGSGGAAVFSGAAPGWWEITGRTCIAAYQPKGAANLAASYINLANPGVLNAAPGVAPTHNPATGWTFDGATQYLTTGILIADETWSAFVRYSGALGATQSWIVGAFDGVDNCGVVYTNGFGSRQYWNFGFRSVGGLFAAAVSGFAGKTAYLNGASDGAISAGAGANARDLWIGCRNANGVTAQWYTGEVEAFACYSSTLTGPEALALSTRMAAL